MGSWRAGPLEEVFCAVGLQEQGVELLIDGHSGALDDVLDGPVELRRY